MTGTQNTEHVNLPSLEPSRQGRSFRSRFFAGGVWSLIGKVLSAAGALTSFVIITANLGREETSTFVYCESLAIIGTVIATAGMQTVIVRVLRRQNQSATTNSILRFACSIVCVFAGMLLLVAAGLTLLALVLEDALVGSIKQHLPIIFCWVILFGANQLVTEFLRGFENFRDAAWVGGQTPGALTSLLLISMLGIFAWTVGLTLTMVFTIQLTALAFTLVWGVLRVAKTSIDADRTAPMFSNVTSPCPNVGWILGQALPNLATQLSTLGVVQLEVLLLGHFAGKTTVATYVGVKRLVQLVAAPLLIINAAIPTLVADLFHKRQIERLELLVRGSATACFIPVVCLSTALTFMPVAILRTVFSDEYIGGADALRILAVANVAFAASGSSGLMLVMTGNQRFSMFSGLLGAAVFIAIAPVLTGRYGIDGVATGAAAGVLIRSLLTVGFCRRQIGIWTTPLFSPYRIRNCVKIMFRRSDHSIL